MRSNATRRSSTARGASGEGSSRCSLSFAKTKASSGCRGHADSTLHSLRCGGWNDQNVRSSAVTNFGDAGAGSVGCSRCDRYVCNGCSTTCEACDRTLCESCLQAADRSGQLLCPTCFGNQASVRCGRCGLFFDRYNEGETLVVDNLGYAWLFCFACAYPLLYGLHDFSTEAREEVAAEINKHGWRLLRDLPDEVEAD